MAHRLCPIGGQQCSSGNSFNFSGEVLGPIDGPCLFCFDEDPHQGPFPDCWRVNSWFPESERVADFIRMGRRKSKFWDDSLLPLQLGVWKVELRQEEFEFVLRHCLRVPEDNVAAEAWWEMPAPG